MTRNRERRRVWLAAGVAAAAASAGVAWQLWKKQAPIAGADVPSQGPASDIWQLRFPQPGGAELAMSSVRGSPLVLNFWASWCAPCRAEHPNLEKLKAEGVTIYGVNYKDKPDAALGFLRDLGNPYAAIGTDESGRMGIDWGIYGVPETFIIDGDGKVVDRFPGPITERSMDDVIRAGLKKAAAE